MRSWRVLLTGILLAAGAGVGFFVGCTRQISEPVNPAIIQGSQSTSTFTITNTYSITPTNTPTATPTLSPTASPTNPGGFTSTFTNTAPPTNTFTNTATPTLTNTPTNSPTPTPNPSIIADFEEGSARDVTGSSSNLSGYWYSVTSAGASATVVSLVAGGGCNTAGHFVDFTAMSGTTAPVYSSLQGDFTNPSASYNINTSAPAGTNAFIFCIKSPSGATTQVWFGVADSTTSGTGDTAGVYVSGITSGWQSVTVCFNHMESQGFTGGNPGHMFDPTTALNFAWKSTASGSSIDIAIDDFQFAQLAAGSCPTLSPTPTPNLTLIDDFNGTGGAGSDSIGNIYQVTDQNGVARNGYWYAASDGGTVISSGTGTVDPTAIEDNVTFSSYAQLAFTFLNPSGTYDATVGGRYTGISFYGKMKAMPTTLCGSSVVMWVDFIDSQAVSEHIVAVPFTTSWQQFTIYYNQAGWDAAADGSSVSLQATTLNTIKFEPQNYGMNNFNTDFLIDDIQLVSSTAPAAPTPIPAKLVNDFVQGINRVITYNGSQFYAGTASGRNGYWFTYADKNGTNMCPNGSAGSPFYPDSPGYAGPTDFAMHWFGTTIVGAYSGYAGGGCNFSQTGSNVNTYNGTAFTGVAFYAKSADSNSYAVALGDDWTECPAGASGCVCGPSGATVIGPNTYPQCSADATYFTSATTSWAPVTIAYSQFGSPGYGGWGTLTVTPPDLPNLYEIKIQINGGNGGVGAYDLWVDNLTFY